MYNVKEKTRKVQFENGTSLKIDNVVGYSSNDTTLGIHTDSGELYIINPSKVLYHRISPIGETTK